MLDQKDENRKLFENFNRCQEMFPQPVERLKKKKKKITKQRVLSIHDILFGKCIIIYFFSFL